MAVFDNVDKVIVIPGGAPSGDGCLQSLGGILEVIILMAFIGIGIDSCGKKNVPASGVPLQSRPTPPQQTPAPAVMPTIRFAPVGSQQFPSPAPMPAYLGREPTNGLQVFGWAGRRWFLSPPPPGHYAYLCVNGGLSWCWRNPPNFRATACVRRGDGAQGWCWKE